MKATTLGKPLLVLLLVASAAACAIHQAAVIDSSGVIVSETRISLDVSVVAYLDTLIEAVGGREGADLFDAELVRQGIARRDGIEPIDVKIANRSTLQVRARVVDIEGALGGVVSVSPTTNGISRMDLELNRKNFSSLSSIFVDELSPAAAFVPLGESDFLERAEYRELASYVLAEFARGRGVDEIIDSSGISLSLAADGELVRAVGGTIESNEAHYWIPAIDAVTLTEPVTLSIEWRP